MKDSHSSRRKYEKEKLVFATNNGKRTEGTPAFLKSGNTASSSSPTLQFRPTSRYPTLSHEPVYTNVLDLSSRIDANRASIMSATMGTPPSALKFSKKKISRPVVSEDTFKDKLPRATIPVKPEPQPQYKIPAAPAPTSKRVVDRGLKLNTNLRQASPILPSPSLKLDRQDAPIQINHEQKEDFLVSIPRPTPMTNLDDGKDETGQPDPHRKYMAPPRVNSISRVQRRMSYIPYGGFDDFLDNYYKDDDTVLEDNQLKSNSRIETLEEEDGVESDSITNTASNASSDAEPAHRHLGPVYENSGHLPSKSHFSSTDSNTDSFGLESDERSLPSVSNDLKSSETLKNPRNDDLLTLQQPPRYPHSQMVMLPARSPVEVPAPTFDRRNVSRNSNNNSPQGYDNNRTNPTVNNLPSYPTNLARPKAIKPMPTSIHGQTSPLSPIPPVHTTHGLVSDIRPLPSVSSPIMRADSTPISHNLAVTPSFSPIPQQSNKSIGNHKNTSVANVSSKVANSKFERNISMMSNSNASSPAIFEVGAEAKEKTKDAIPCHPDDKLMIPSPKIVTHGDAMQEEQRLRQKSQITPDDEVELAKVYLNALETLENKPSLAPDQASYNTRINVYRTRAVELLKKNAYPSKTQNTVPEALFLIGQFHSQGVLGFRRDLGKAFELYSLAAKKGHPLSNYRVAVCLQTGTGVKPDTSKCVAIYKKAAEMDVVEAMFRIALIYLNGLLGQKRNISLGVQWLERACKSKGPESVRAMYELAKIYEQPDRYGVSATPERKFELYKQSAVYGYAAAQCKLGECYEHGLLGCLAEPRRSIFWYTRAAEQDYGEAELGLSGWYLTGSEGILPKNGEEALLWAHKAACKGLAKAQYAVGFMMEQGIGVAADPSSAHNWYIRAAKQGFPKAKKRLEEQALSSKQTHSKAPKKKQQEQCVVM
ncbi:Chitin synthase regulatory factor Chr3 [Schizosaccharomyces pombe]